VIRLGIVYHMPFWRAADGTLRELEGSFARYVDSLAPYFDEVSLCVPWLDEAPKSEGEDGTPIRSSNVTVSPLPPFEGPIHFYPRLATMLPRLVGWARRIDLLHCRVPSPAAVFPFAAARFVRRPAFVLVVGDLAALRPSMPYRGLKRALWRAYTGFEERNIRWMVKHALTFANGSALAAKHAGDGSRVVETTTTTIGVDDIAARADTCAGSRVRMLAVSRIEPRKNVRVLPAAIRLLLDDGIDVTLDVVGPAPGGPGAQERSQIVGEAQRLGVGDRVSLVGPMPLAQLLPRYAGYDVFVLPTLPGEGIPRVLLEAMAGGLPIVATRVAGIPSLVTHEQNGLLLDEPSPQAIAGAVARIVRDSSLRQRLIANGYQTARRHTLEQQAARMMATVASSLHVALRQPAALPVA
jgi:glycosyltransferase involved in cell wall biosynthesis